MMRRDGFLPPYRSHNISYTPSTFPERSDDRDLKLAIMAQAYRTYSPSRIADAICDRLIHNAHVVALKGPSGTPNI